MSMIAAGSFFYLYSPISRSSIFMRIIPAKIVKKAPAGNTIEKNRIQPNCMNSVLY